MATITYNDYTIPDPNGEFQVFWRGESYRFIMDFDITGADYSELESNVAEMFTALSAKYKDLTVTMGGSTFFETNQSTNTGFNLIPEIKKVNGPKDSAGLFERWQFSVDVILPADKLGGAPFNLGLIDIKCKATIPFSAIYNLSFVGRWKVVTEGSAASTQYLAQIKSVITTYFLTPYFAGKSWDVLVNKLDIDQTNKTLSFVIVYKERPIEYTGQGGTDYIMGDIQLKKRNNQSIGIPWYIPYPESAAHKDHAEMVGNLPPDAAGIIPPITYEVQGDIIFTKDTVTTLAQAQTLWESEIRSWAISQLEATYAFGAEITDAEMLDFRASDYALSFSVTFIDLRAIDNIFQLSVDVDSDDNERWQLEDIADGENHSAIITTLGIRALYTIAINIQTLNNPPVKKSWEKFLPKEINENSTYGFLRLDKRRAGKAFRKEIIEKSIVYYSETWVYTYVYFDKITKAKLSAGIEDSMVK